MLWLSYTILLRCPKLTFDFICKVDLNSSMFSFFHMSSFPYQEHHSSVQSVLHFCRVFKNAVLLPSLRLIGASVVVAIQVSCLVIDFQRIEKFLALLHI